MLFSLENYTAGHRFLLERVARAAEIADPVAFSAGSFHWPLLKAERKGSALPIDGVLVPDWEIGQRGAYPGLRLGARLYELAGVRFVNVQFCFDQYLEESALNFLAVGRKDYRRLYRLARRALRANEPGGDGPVLSDELRDNLWTNTIGYLENQRLDRLRQYGGRARRGVLLTGPPGNGKTMACRWIWEECRRRNWEYRIVTPSTYQQARRGCNPEEAIRSLFSVQRRGIVFFDDMDVALRDRDKTTDSDDQAIFLTAIDGIQIKEGVVYVFATNSPLSQIDRAFKRPGRIDVALHFDAPDAELRSRLLERWHPDIMAHIDLEEAVDDTAGYSFAEIDELRNLLILHHDDEGTWSWPWALEQFACNREDLQARFGRAIGFSVPQFESVEFSPEE
jgi:cell division protease FtsH